MLYVEVYPDVQSDVCWSQLIMNMETLLFYLLV